MVNHGDDQLEFTAVCDNVFSSHQELDHLRNPVMSLPLFCISV